MYTTELNRKLITTFSPDIGHFLPSIEGSKGRKEIVSGTEQ